MEPAVGTDSHTSTPSRPAIPAWPPLAAGQARTVLRKLRDLDLRGARVEINGSLKVGVSGCLSPDSPVSGELRYRLEVPEEDERWLAIAWENGVLALTLTDGERQLASRRIALLEDPEGRASAPEVAARMDPENAGPREVEHFLRRLVRSVFNGES
jgi:hypothetical protein